MTATLPAAYPKAEALAHLVCDLMRFNATNEVEAPGGRPCCENQPGRPQGCEMYAK